MTQREEEKILSKNEVDIGKLLSTWSLVYIIFLIIPLFINFIFPNPIFIWLMYFMLTGIVSIPISMKSTENDYETFKQRLSEILFEQSFEDWVTQKERENAERKQILEDLENIGSNYFSKLQSPEQVQDRIEVLKRFKTVAQTSDQDKSREKLVSLIEKKFPEEFRGYKTSNLENIKNQHARIRTGLNNLVSTHDKKLRELDRKFKKWDDLIELLQSFREGIPVSLQRICQLIELDESMTETLLKSILSQESEIGEYYELEQSFIRGTFQNLSLFKQEKLENAIKASYQTCGNCQTNVDLLLQKCPNCDNTLNRCDICKQGFRPEDQVSVCPLCKRDFHFKHLHEIIRISGKCPTCKGELKEDQIKSKSAK